MLLHILGIDVTYIACVVRSLVIEALPLSRNFLERPRTSPVPKRPHR